MAKQVTEVTLRIEWDDEVNDNPVGWMWSGLLDMAHEDVEVTDYRNLPVEVFGD